MNKQRRSKQRHRGYENMTAVRDALKGAGFNCWHTGTRERGWSIKTTPGYMVALNGADSAEHMKNIEDRIAEDLTVARRVAEQFPGVTVRRSIANLYRQGRPWKWHNVVVHVPFGGLS